MVPKLLSAARGALSPDLAVYAGGGWVALGAGVFHIGAGLIVGGLWITACGVLVERERGRKGSA